MKQTLLLMKLFVLAVIFLPAVTSAQLIYTGANLDINNVNARINNELSHFWDPVTQSPTYEVPKGTGNMSIYTGSLWIGGLDPQGNLHMAAQTYNQNGEVGYYPGPLDTVNGTSADPVVWNSIWKVNKADIDYHIAHWNDLMYIMPASISTWPGNAPAGSNFNPVLAPFFDSNANGIYEPALGEFPSILGDQAIYFICNDNYAPSPFNIPSLGIEIHGMAYAFDRPNDPALNNSIFFNYQIANYSGIDYHDVYVSLFTDFDLGNFADDYVGTDVGRNMVYVYNSVPQVYDPAQGVKFLSPTLSNSIYYQNINNVPYGNPSGSGFYSYCKGEWLDGLPLTFGGDGRGAGIGGTNTPSSYMFSGTTDTAFPGQDWSMPGAGLSPSDVRMNGSIGPLNLVAGGHFDMDVAYITGFAAGPRGAVKVLQNYADDIGARYLNGTLTSLTQAPANSPTTIHLSPTLVDNELNITFDQELSGSYQLEILSVDGKLVMNKTQMKGNAKLDLASLTSGVYFVKITSSEGVLTQRIMKQ
ncbi:hypothetical protein BH11BAC2_BH11BAC2_05290 [soil metagenome]